MSFILEALRRTDRERKSGINPNLETVVEFAPKPPARPRSPWLAATAIVALGAGAALLLWPRSPQQAPLPVVTAAQPAPPTPPPSTPMTSPVPAVPSVSMAKDVGVPRRIEPTAPASPAAPEAARTQDPADVPTDGSLSAAMRRRQNQVRPAQGAPHRDAGNPPVPAHPNTPPQTAVARPAPGAERAELSRPPTRRIVPTPETYIESETAALALPPDAAVAAPLQRGDGAAPETPVSSPPPPPADVPLTEAPLVESLPPNQRQLFDGIRLDAHVYADDPAKRFVLIQMRGHRVGDTVGTGDIVIEAITPDGAVLRSGSVRALTPHP